MEINMTAKFESKITTDETLRLLHRALYLSAVKMKEIAIRKAPVDIGLLRSSISLFPNTQNSNRYTVTDGVVYGAYVEYGTSPHWAPIKPLIEWAKRHGGDEGFGYALRAKIAKSGTNAHPFFRPAIRETREKWVPYYFKKVFGG